MPTPTLEAQINDLLKFVFSEPSAPGKEAIKKALWEDWRPVLKQHLKLTAQQKEAFDNISDEEVAAMKHVMARSVKAGKMPKVRVVPKASADRPLGGVVRTFKPPTGGTRPNGGGSNNIYC